ncbi:hypothetical protein K431DRAFT_310128 [Polychaeton citri CBS 116435]|uniref:Uncharacterized protein n=1 Tax=Polychaeton citri CBS 116435 TaxID=1314669 RepID=A0A9P4QE63_9PEZI|nr:hypothetical protein K431DRAFT_310128 [Polychaeton citri CBS 116435]
MLPAVPKTAAQYSCTKPRQSWSRETPRLQPLRLLKVDLMEAAEDAASFSSKDNRPHQSQSLALLYNLTGPVYRHKFCCIQSVTLALLHVLKEATAMGLFSVLPDHLNFIEIWIARIFLLLAVLCVGPWIVVLIYDFVLYVWRAATYDLPSIGGRARGRARPRAPSLAERPNGHRRRISLPGIGMKHDEKPALHASGSTVESDGGDGIKSRPKS